MNTRNPGNLELTSVKKTTPPWFKKASKGNGRCTHCKTEYLKGELNAQKHCRHCADELGEAHPFNQAEQQINPVTPEADAPQADAIRSGDAMTYHADSGDYRARVMRIDAATTYTEETFWLWLLDENLPVKATRDRLSKKAALEKETLQTEVQSAS